MNVAKGNKNMTREKLIQDWKNDLEDFKNAISESEREACRKDAKSTMLLGIKLYGFNFADECNEIRKDILK